MNAQVLSYFWTSQGVSLLAHAVLLASLGAMVSTIKPIGEGTVSIEIISDFNAATIPPKGNQVRVPDVDNKPVDAKTPEAANQSQQQSSPSVVAQASAESAPVVAAVKNKIVPIEAKPSPSDISVANTKTAPKPKAVSKNMMPSRPRPGSVARQKAKAQPHMPFGIPTGVKDADLLKQYPGNVPPEYPMAERIARHEGRVEFFAYVGEEGHLKEIRFKKSSGRESFDLAALEAFKKYRFFPGQSGWVAKRFVFSLRGSALTYGGQLRR